MSRSPRQPRGFTLNELLIVMGIAILIIALAVPAFSYMTQSRSLESAENRISSYLQATRAEAIGLQQPRGVLFFEDSATDQVTMAQVYFPPGQTVLAGTPYELEVFGGRDEVTLPPGVGLQAIPNAAGSGSVPNPPWPNYCLVLFDGDGRLLLDTYRINTTTTALYRRVSQPAPAKMTPLPLSNALSNIGFILFDKNAYESQQTAVRTQFLKENAVPYLVNRYGGSLIKAE